MSYCMSLPRCQPWSWSGWRPGFLPAVTLPLCSVSWETHRDWAPCYPSNSHPLFLPGVSPASVRTLVIAGGLSCNSVIPRTFSSWPSTVKNLYQSELMDASSAPWSIILHWCNILPSGSSFKLAPLSFGHIPSFYDQLLPHGTIRCSWLPNMFPAQPCISPFSREPWSLERRMVMETRVLSAPGGTPASRHSQQTELGSRRACRRAYQCPSIPLLSMPEPRHSHPSS